MLNRQPTVLVVDDEEMLRRLLARALAGAGFAVLEAENGELALQAAQSLPGERALNLVVTDVNMPVMDGLEFARAFRPLHPRVPILFITGKDLRASLTDAGRLEGEVLLKPFGPDAFLDTVVRMLARGISAERTPA